MTRRCHLKAVAAALILATSTACSALVSEEDGGGGDTLASMTPITLNINGIGAPGDLNMQALQAFADEIDEQTDGKITFDVFAPGALLPTPEALKGTAAGVADVAVIVGVSSPNELPITVWLSTLGSLVEKSYPAGLYQGGAALNDFFLTNKELQAEYEAAGVHVLNANMFVQQFDLLCTKPVRTLAEAKGLRTVVQGPVWVEQAEAIGMEPTFMTTADIYEAFQRGAVDCNISGPTPNVLSGVTDVAKNWTPVAMTGNMGGYTLTVNKDLWDGFPDEVREIFEDAAATHWKTLSTLQLEAHKAVATATKSDKIVWHEPAADLLAAVERIQEDQIDRMIDDAPAGVADPAATVAKFKELIEKWRAVMPEDAYVNKDGVATWQTYADATGRDYSAFFDQVLSESFGG